MSKGKPTKTADLLADAGRLLYGQEGWVGPLSDDIGVAERTIYAWETGRRELHANNTAMQRVENLLREEAQRMLALGDRIRVHIASAPPRKAPAARPTP